MNEQINLNILKLVVIITDRNKSKKLNAVISGHKPGLYFMINGQGTATSEILDLFGLGGMEKAVVACVCHAAFVNEFMGKVSEEMNLKKPGNGIAFSIPLDSVSKPLIKELEIEGRKIKERLEKHMEKTTSNLPEKSDYNLVIAISDQGNSDEIMEAAKSAGARGGTIIKARRIGLEEIIKFFGISIQGEKEVITILTKKELKADIMKAVNEKCGMHTPAKTIVFSIPVDSIEGIELGINN